MIEEFKEYIIHHAFNYGYYGTEDIKEITITKIGDTFQYFITIRYSIRTDIERSFVGSIKVSDFQKFLRLKKLKKLERL